MALVPSNSPYRLKATEYYMSTLFVFFMLDKCALEFECQDYIDRTLTSIIFIDSLLSAFSYWLRACQRCTEWRPRIFSSYGTYYLSWDSVIWQSCEAHETNVMTCDGNNNPRSYYLHYTCLRLCCERRYNIHNLKVSQISHLQSGIDCFVYLFPASLSISVTKCICSKVYIAEY